MKALEMKPMIPYRAITDSKDTSIRAGQIMWVSENGYLNIPDECGGGFYTKDEWIMTSTGDFEVEEDENYYVIHEKWSEGIRKKNKL